MNNYLMPSEKEMNTMQEWGEKHFNEKCEITSWWNMFDFKKRNEEPRYLIIECHPTEIATHIECKCSKCGLKIDASDYDCW